MVIGKWGNIQQQFETDAEFLQWQAFAKRALNVTVIRVEKSDAKSARQKREVKPSV